MFTTRCGCSRHGVDVHDTVWMFKTRCRCSRHGVNVHDTVWMFKTRCGCSRHGVDVQDTVWMFKTRCGCSRHGVDVQDTVWMFTTPCECSRHGVDVPDPVHRGRDRSRGRELTRLLIDQVGLVISVVEEIDTTFRKCIMHRHSLCVLRMCKINIRMSCFKLKANI